MFGEGKFSSSKIQQVYKMHAAFYTYFLWYIVLGCGMRYMLDKTCTMCCGIQQAVLYVQCGNPYKTLDINVPLTGKYKIKSKMYKQRKSSPDIELYKP